ncbi:Oidioi.mRNA.OKI2018_I69.chr2.g7950.t1.cds [Oikopleura dioica]|uniref:Mediator of RNA polymerase II transcription subunit 18 n=1 Tax=Oikopleura dioica TaxID=34765 RepID=A0ABN7TCG8_OIKDI|nr:Oidioi.mRNA.OKI2018_I69.chr2.g7950.t1.cds [Oikopleura dioica]
MKAPGLEEDIGYNPIVSSIKTESGLSRESGTFSEYSLQGSVKDEFVEDVKNRLRGLCDNVEAEPFLDHEITYKLENSTGGSATLRVSRSMAQSKMPWQLKYVGAVESATKSCLMRNQVTVGCSENVTSFLTELGFRAETEFLNKGYLYRKGRVKITLSKLNKMKEPGQSAEANRIPLTKSHFVEVSVTVLTGTEDPGKLST